VRIPENTGIEMRDIDGMSTAASLTTVAVDQPSVPLP
jgi:hypothetical protein